MTLLKTIYRACTWTGVLAEKEVFNLFSGLVRQEGLERAQQRQSLVPDLRIAIQPQAVADAEVVRDLRIRGEAGKIFKLQQNLLRAWNTSVRSMQGQTCSLKNISPRPETQIENIIGHVRAQLAQLSGGGRGARNCVWKFCIWLHGW